MKVAAALTLTLAALVLNPVPVEAQASADITQSPAWASCKPDPVTMDSLIAAIPCTAKTDPAAARRVLDYMYSVAGVEARMKVAREQSHGDGMLYASLLGKWAGELSNADTEVRIMAEKQIISTIVNVPNAPVKLTKCGERHALDSPQWYISASWLPNDKALTAVKVRVETQDAFGTTLQTDDLSPTGNYAANVEASDLWTVGEAHMPARANISRVRCTIVAAIDANGQIWNAPAKAPAPTKTSKPH